MTLKSGRKGDLPLRDADEARRRFLVRALSFGLFAGGAGWNLPALAQLFGKLPGKLPEGKSVFDMRGDVWVNGQRATQETALKATDKVQVGSNSYLIAAVGGSAFIVRENSILEMGGKQLLVNSMRLLTGKLLGVFGKRSGSERLNLATPTATIGIRGTGLYAEADPEKTYLCTCYGKTELASTADPKAKEEISARHHDAPRWILAQPDQGKRIVPAPFINHTDLELMTIEALVGREVPFGLPGDQYEGPRREY